MFFTPWLSVAARRSGRLPFLGRDELMKIRRPILAACLVLTAASLSASTSAANAAAGPVVTGPSPTTNCTFSSAR